MRPARGHPGDRDCMAGSELGDSCDALSNTRSRLNKEGRKGQPVRAPCSDYIALEQERVDVAPHLRGPAIRFPFLVWSANRAERM